MNKVKLIVTHENKFSWENIIADWSKRGGDFLVVSDDTSFFLFISDELLRKIDFGKQPTPTPGYLEMSEWKLRFWEHNSETVRNYISGPNSIEDAYEEIKRLRILADKSVVLTIYGEWDENNR